MEFEEMGKGNYWNPEAEGDVLEGNVTAITESQFEGQMNYTIKQKDGKELVTPTHKVLCGRMTKVAIGDFVRIEYLGAEAPKLKGYQPTRIYRVWRGIP